MKNQKSNFAKLALFTFLSLGLMLAGCSGEDGADGEIGPQGPAGQDGLDGNANVVASDWFKFNWTSANPTQSEMQIDIPEIADITENGGLVLMYLKTDLGDGNTITYPLPNDFGDNIIFKYTIVDAPDAEIIGVIVRLEDPDANGVYLDVQNNPDYTLRYILVPANALSTNGRMAIPKTYEEAAELYGFDK